MKYKINVSLLLATLMLCCSILISSFCSESHSDIEKNSSTASGITTSKATENIPNSSEMRGLWVSYITLDMTSSDMTFEAFKNKFDNIVQTAKNYKFNTLIVQIRPFCDALYKSEIFPYSHILSGTQGKDPGYDPLEYMCEAAHDYDLSIHVWINPYRIATSTTPQKLSKENPYTKNPDTGLTLSTGKYLNPAKKAVRKLITDGVAEIAENYPIDGIQFDDYFYPTDIENADSAEYNAYIKTVDNNYKPLTLEEWRTENVNILIAEVYSTIKSINNKIVFGISPQGNIENNKTFCADIKNWSEIAGYVDYICPQMYYSINNPTVSFESSLNEWKQFEYHTKIKVYIGLGAYKAGTNADSGTWLESDRVLADELTLLRKYDYDGYMIYDYSAFETKTVEKELNNLLSIIE